MTNRIVRKNGFIVCEMDVISHEIARGCAREIAERIAEKAPTAEGHPLTLNQYSAAIDRMNRRDEIWAMGSGY